MPQLTDLQQGWRAFIGLIGVIAIATTLALATRIYLVQPEAVAQACASDGNTWRCMVRAAAVFGFLHNVFGWSALLAGLLATVSRWRWLALVAIVLGVAGASLYSFALSGFGLLLGALVWIQSPPLPDAEHEREQKA